MNLYEHTIIARQDASPSEIKQLTEKYSKIVKKMKARLLKQKILNQRNFLIYILVCYRSIEVAILTFFSYIMVKDIVV